MCINSREIIKSPSVFFAEAPSSPSFDRMSLSSSSSCSSISVDSNYLEDSITIVNNFKKSRDIKEEINSATVKYIAEGAYGEISIARLKNNTKVAIKKFKAEEYRNDYNENIIRYKIYSEVANLIKLQGKSKFVELLGIHLTDNKEPYMSMELVMEYADGDLEKYENALVQNEKVKLSYANTRYIALELFLIIKACKEVKIDYIDLHSGNILIFNNQKRFKLADFDEIKTFVDSSSMIGKASFELLNLSCANHGKSEEKLRKIRINTIDNKKEFKNQISEFLGGDNILCNIILEPIIAYKEGLKVKTDELEDMISQLQSYRLKAFPTLKMI
jgi:hypothetical protein